MPVDRAKNRDRHPEPGLTDLAPLYRGAQWTAWGAGIGWAPASGAHPVHDRFGNLSGVSRADRSVICQLSSSRKGTTG